MAYFPMVPKGGAGGFSELLIDYDPNEMADITITLSHAASAEGHTPESYTATLDNTGEVEVDVKNLGLWVITWTHEGQSYREEYDVHYYGYHHIMLHEGFTWRQWVVAGGINIQKYNSLADLLANQEDIRRLCTIHDAVDYMCEFVHVNNDLETIINTGLFAKWVNLRDYALDNMEANSAIKDAMDEADLYGYGELVFEGNEWKPKGNVPVMTSNTTPYGEVSGIGSYSGAEPYRAFDGDDATEWHAPADATNVYLSYKSVNPMKCSKVKAVIKFSGAIPARTIKIQGSNDGSTWDDIGTLNTEQTTSTITKTYEVDVTSSTYHLYHRIFSAEKLHQASVWSVQFVSLQFYGRELKVSVPTMTSNTAPYGEASASSSWTGHDAWDGFNPRNANPWLAYPPANQWLQYNFKAKKKILKAVFLMSTANLATVKDFKILASNDNFVNDTNVLYEGTAPYTDVIQSIDLDTDNEYQYYRILGLNSYGSANDYVGLMWLQFYGKDYSEKEFANDGSKWLYDHGVELETFVYNTVGNGSVSKSENGEIYVEVPAATQRATSALVNVNLANYSLLRAVAGSRFYEKPQLSITPSSAPSYSGATFDSYYVLDPPIDKYNLSLSAVSINADRYVGIYCGNNTGSRNNIGTIAELWLE